ncbi:MAG: TIGR01777 family oxidoreductase [Pirellulaceae bacterium]|nr:TIGR01777 family oxidoreductase [Pirellulaceae bacterium]
MKIAISGASGFIGKALVRKLSKQHTIYRLMRKKTTEKKSIYWNYRDGEIEQEKLEGLDAFIHLAGYSVARIWTQRARKKIEESRVLGTRFLVDQLSSLSLPPKIFLSASAIGYYPANTEVELTEKSGHGTGFLSNICQKWENEGAAIVKKSSSHHSTRLCYFRTGLVLDKAGGALGQMLPFFRWGLGGKFGTGKQYWSWIALADYLNAVEHILADDDISGPVNLVSPHPVTNREFTQLVARSVNRPAFCHLPALLLKLGLGEMSKEMLLSSQFVLPKKLLDTDFKFKFPFLKNFLAET